LLTFIGILKMVVFSSIRDVCELVTDGTHYTPKNVGAGFPFLTVKDIKDDHLDLKTCSFISEEDYIEACNGNSSPHPLDVLFSKDGTVGKVHVVKTEEPFAVLSSIAILRPKIDVIDSNYLGYTLKSPLVLDQAIRRKTGSAIRRIILADLSSVKIPLPPIDQQKRIAAILDKAEELRRLRRQSIEQLDILSRSIFIEMFGDPVTNPKGWNRFIFSDLISKIESGHSPNCLDRPKTDQEWGVLKLGAVTWCDYNQSENKALPPHEKPHLELEVKVGDLLFVRKNTYELVAASVLVRSTMPKLLLPDLIFRLRLNSDALINSCFLHKLLINPSKRREIQKLASGAASSMPNISKAKLYSVLIEVPPLSLQQEFAQRIEAIEHLKSQHRESLAQLDKLFASLQHRAFRGEL
jgi:type I restriction enzyme, S subunit